MGGHGATLHLVNARQGMIHLCFRVKAEAVGGRLLSVLRGWKWVEALH